MGDLQQLVRGLASKKKGLTLDWGRVGHSNPLYHLDKGIGLAANIDFVGGKAEIVQSRIRRGPDSDTPPSSCRRPCP